MIFSRKKRQGKSAPVVATAPVAPIASMSPDDRALLELLADELVGCIECADGSVILDGATATYACTRPVPAIEIEYPDYVVTLHMDVYRYTEEDR